MEIKKYSSYAAIDRDLEILKLEKEISYQKLVLSIKDTKNSVTPELIISGFLAPYKKVIPDFFRSILNSVGPYILNYLFNNKR